MPAKFRGIPYWKSECGRAVVYVGDCREVMEHMDPGRFHAIVTDPPYGLEFMGKEWDAPWKASGSVDAQQRRAAELDDPVKAKYIRHQTTYGMSDPHGFQTWFMERAGMMLRVARPGAHILSFGGTRMWHRMACAIEDAGWQIRDTIMWVYGSGFPKGQDVSKGIDKELGFERTETEIKKRSSVLGGLLHSNHMGSGGYGYSQEWGVSEPATAAARQWEGWNTQLKPALEPIVLARKPMPGNVAQCVMENGTGALNVDGCRVGTTGSVITRQIQSYSCSGSGVYQFNSGDAGSTSMNGGFSKTQKDGRYPPNLIHDGSDDVVGLLPDGAARFYYTAKADSGDRPHGKGATVHPTVKPLDLMQYLVRLVCAPGGTVLDPFMGSGSTGCAAILEGMRFVGIEQSEEYADIAIGRIKLALMERSEDDTPDAPSPPVRREAVAPPPPRKMRGSS